ncbi:ABC transporter ATP-binding protein YtrE [Botrimarina colliarenosi]|uniref:ABC transporter ATP-binding protein YtrE n=1 Tax=Botrimarina colliarenosi TaxID=2528001 RepID=A0A5C6AL26_9BACT|nr:ABC transporter ATP-binding protein [Botrimarina colliarenosi]TWU00157.1 ABC transporter ATP-binding protein YtrE [Botrimarina colliarenosi]
MLLLEGVRKSYAQPGAERLPILDVPRLAVGAGEQVVIRGRSGCGKTTLLNAIAGLTTIDAGKIAIKGVDLTRLPEAARDRFRARHIGYVFQTFNLLPGFTALENVLLGMTFTGQRPDRARAADLLNRVGLGHRGHHKPAAMSVGEQQRTAVARALANRPLLLLADEPTANVDPGHQQQIIDLLRGVCRDENVSMLLVTHSNEVSDQFDRVEQLEEVNQVLKANV